MHEPLLLRKHQKIRSNKVNSREIAIQLLLLVNIRELQG